MKRLQKSIQYGLLTLYCLFSIFPFIWMASASLKLPEDVLTVPIEWIPPVVQPDNYPTVLFEPRFAGYALVDVMKNSILVAVATSLLSIGLSTFVGYGFAKFRFKGRDTMLWVMLGTTLQPFSSIIIPLYLIVQRMGLLNSL